MQSRTRICAHFSECKQAAELRLSGGGRCVLLPFADFLDPVFQLIALEKNDEYRLVHVVALDPRRKIKSSELSI